MLRPEDDMCTTKRMGNRSAITLTTSQFVAWLTEKWTTGSTTLRLVVPPWNWQNHTFYHKNPLSNYQFWVRYTISYLVRIFTSFIFKVIFSWFCNQFMTLTKMGQWTAQQLPSIGRILFKLGTDIRHKENLSQNEDVQICLVNNRWHINTIAFEKMIDETDKYEIVTYQIKIAESCGCFVSPYSTFAFMSWVSPKIVNQDIVIPPTHKPHLPHISILSITYKKLKESQSVQIYFMAVSLNLGCLTLSEINNCKLNSGVNY